MLVEMHMQYDYGASVRTLLVHCQRRLLDTLQVRILSRPSNGAWLCGGTQASKSFGGLENWLRRHPPDGHRSPQIFSSSLDPFVRYKLVKSAVSECRPKTIVRDSPRSQCNSIILICFLCRALGILDIRTHRPIRGIASVVDSTARLFAFIYRTGRLFLRMQR